MLKYTLTCGKSADILKGYPDNHFDACVMDPPYMLHFLGKDWDSADIDMLPEFKECLRVLKPGGYILAFSATRTYHHLAHSIEQAGFEIRDMITWIYSSGFPKSQDVGRQIDRANKTYITKGTGKTRVSGGPKDYDGSPLTRTEETIHIPQSDGAKQWSGYGTALKPASEPICMARKPLNQTVAKNMVQHGVGALNIDTSRIPYEDDEVVNTAPRKAGIGVKKFTKGDDFTTDTTDEELKTDGFMAAASALGRFPSNIIGEIAEPYQKYFYQAKVSRAERHIGFKDPGARHPGADGGGYQVHDVNDENIVHGIGDQSGNNHPTVKPVALMRYLINLVCPPSTPTYQRKILDPFNGSGSTGMAATELGHEYHGIDLDQHYLDISKARIDGWFLKNNPLPEIFKVTNGSS